MSRFLPAVAVLACAGAAVAQDPPPTRPAQPVPGQPTYKLPTKDRRTLADVLKDPAVKNLKAVTPAVASPLLDWLGVDSRAGAEYQRIVVDGDDPDQLLKLVKAAGEAYQKASYERDNGERNRRAGQEEVETLEANREVRSAHVSAAEVAVRRAQVDAARLERLAANGVGSKDELDKARLDVRAAEAQLAIRVAEVKEVEVKIKHAKKRLEDAKAAPVRPVPVRPVDPVPPPPAPPAGTDQKAVAELKAKLEKLTAEADKLATEAQKAQEESKAAAAELRKVLDIAIRGIVAPGTIEKAEARAKDAKEAAEAAKKKVDEKKAEVAAAKAKLKEIEK